MNRRAILVGAMVAGAALSGCAAPPPLPAAATGPPPPPRAATALPPLRLPPAALGTARHALSQRLTVTRLDRRDEPAQQVDVQLQLDASGLLLAGFAFGQRVLLVRWDGVELQVQRHPRLPAEVDTDRLLRDLCLVFWPAEAVRAALPAGWSWADTGRGQELRRGGATQLTVSRPGERVVEIINATEGYRLLIESQALEGS